MSDFGRQDVSDKIHNAVKPDSEKSTPEHLTDKVKGALDNAAGHGTSNNDKSTFQQASDAIFGDSKNTAIGYLGVRSRGGRGRAAVVGARRHYMGSSTASDDPSV